MLLSLKIHHFSLIEDIEIQFHPHMNILSGETGAGKSIILGSLKLILGDTARTDWIRSQEESASITAIFDIEQDTQVQSFLHKNLSSYHEAEPILIIEREIYRDQPSVARVNHTRVLVQFLKELGELLIDMNDQAEHYALLDKKNHFQFFISYLEKNQELEQYQDFFYEILSEKKALEKEEAEWQKAVEQKSYYEYVKNELASISWEEILEQSEENHLSEQSHKNILGEASQKISQIFQHPEAPLLEIYQDMIRILESLMDQNLYPHPEDVEELKKTIPLLQKIHQFALKQSEIYELDLELYQAKYEKMMEYEEIARKYRRKGKDLYEYYESIQQLLEHIDQGEYTLREKKAFFEKRVQDLGKKALDLMKDFDSEKKLFESALEKEFQDIGLAHAKIDLQFKILEDEDGNITLPNGKKVKLSKTGIGQVEMFLQSNVGEPFKPLQKIASGGERSRIILSLKSILSEKFQVPSQVFDEIDTGISGDIALKVANKLKALSKKRQIICITHSPQIASRGDYHYKVFKFISGDRTQTSIEKCEKESRVKEIASMLSGDTPTESSLSYAKELLGDYSSPHS